MITVGWGWLLFFGVLVAVIALEGKRQARKYGKPKGASMLRAGFLELQRQLEPERKVEWIQEEPEVDEHAQAGDKPKAGLP
jgi:hypothetical protein